jgi:hypothetical protein
MRKVDLYVSAARRKNKGRSDQAAVHDFEVAWGGLLPGTADAVGRYLVDHAETRAINTLRQRLAALAQWHIEQGFPDPTKAPVTRKVLRGIQALHPAQEKRALPLQLEQLELVAGRLDQLLTGAVASGDIPAQL